MGAPPNIYERVNQLNSRMQWTELQQVSRQASEEAIQRADWQLAGRMQPWKLDNDSKAY